MAIEADYHTLNLERQPCGLAKSNDRYNLLAIKKQQDFGFRCYCFKSSLHRSQ
jgi:CO dehydrogenase nickel-insertion accessory protein CooC1